MLEPRRLAARAAAARMAAILNEPVGRTVGYSVRFDSKTSAATRVEVVTEGVLLQRLQRDPSLEGIAAVVFDEFHERSLDADLALALAVDVQRAWRPELRLVVMSATLGAVGSSVAALLGEDRSPAPLLVSEGKSYPVETVYLGPPGLNRGDLEAATVAAVKQALGNHPGVDGGDVLVFLPGAAEIIRVVRELTQWGGPGRYRLDVVPLYGALPAADQSAALTPAAPGSRRVVVSTPIAESSLTIPGVRVVVDSGLARRPRFDPRKGMTRLDTAKISLASADQRRGRAGRVAPGTCYRLWSEAAHAGLAADTPPEIRSADLAPLALNLAAWGADPADLPWLDPPPAGQMEAATDLLVRLGAVRRAGPDGRLGGKMTVTTTPAGRRMARLPVHPRIARMLLWAAERGPESARLACQLAAIMDNRDILRGRDVPIDIRARLGALWDRGEGSDAAARRSLAPSPPAAESEADDTSNPSAANDRKKNTNTGSASPTAPVRVPIGTKLPSGRKKMKGVPRGKPANRETIAAARAARAKADAAAAGRTDGRSSGRSSAGAANQGGAGSVYDGFIGWEVDRAAVEEAGRVARQLLASLGDVCRNAVRDGDETWCAPGIGEGDPTGPVFDFLLGEGVNEAGVLLAMAYPDRVGVCRSRGAAFQLSSGKGAATVPRSDPLARAEVLAIAELAGDLATGSRNDMVRLAAPVPLTALEPADDMADDAAGGIGRSSRDGGRRGGCLAELLCERRDNVAWAPASKAVVARRQLAVGSVVLREAPFTPGPDDTVAAMLEGIRAIGVRDALGWSQKTEAWRQKVIWLRRMAAGAADDTLPDLSDVALEDTLEEWLAPMLPGVTSISALRRLDGDGLLRCLLSYEQQSMVEEACPSHIVVPSGSKLPLDYGAPGGRPVLRARLQELFGMADTPTVGLRPGGTVSVEVHLLSPASRPVQVTTDLASFWANAYFEVVKELKGRYPKHYWPDDPLVAEATNRAKPRKK